MVRPTLGIETQLPLVGFKLRSQILQMLFTLHTFKKKTISKVYRWFYMQEGFRIAQSVLTVIHLPRRLFYEKRVPTLCMGITFFEKSV